MNRALLVLVAGLLGGCTTAGPFVTEIASDGNNGLTVTKCMVNYNDFTGAVSNDKCMTSHLTLYKDRYQ